MNKPISDSAVSQLFTQARSHHAWTPHPVTHETLQELYELLKWGPTSVNANPARFLFITSEREKEKLYPALIDGNVEQVRAAPVTVVIAYDKDYLDYIGRLFPHYDVRSIFEGNHRLIADTAMRNSSLQGGYLILAARALGLDVCPMSGFNNELLDETFFKESSWRSNFICTIGHGDPTKLHPRGPRLAFDEACKII